MRIRYHVAVLLFPSVMLFAHQDNNGSYPRTRAGKQVEAYVKAFNAGESDMRDFFKQHSDNSDPNAPALEERLGRYKQMHERLGSLQLSKINNSSNDTFSGLFQSNNGGQVNIEFEFRRTAPYNLLGIRVEDAGNGAQPIPADHKKNNAELISTVRHSAAKLAKEDRFSGVILIALNDKPVFEQAYGYANRERKIPNSIDTRFDIGSINKSFTQLAIDQLAAEGKLSYDDPIEKFLPDYPNKEAAEKVTVRELLDMRSGIGDIFGDRYQAAAKETLTTLEAYLPLFADKPLEFEPGTSRRYSNGGYIVLGLIIQKASRMNYYTYVRTHIFQPAGMSHTDSFERDSLPVECALGYTGDGAARRSNYETLPERASSAGGGYSTVHDLLKYAIALEHGTITPKGIERQGGLGIAGGAPGLNAALEWGDKSGYTIVVLSNFDPPTAESMARHIRAWLPVTR